MLTKNDITQLKKTFVTEGEFSRTLNDHFNTLMEFLVAFREDFEEFKQEMVDFKKEMIEFRSEMRDITAYQQRRIDRLEDKVFS